MNYIIKNQINYFNEALLLAMHVCNVEKDKDLDLPIKGRNIEDFGDSVGSQYQDLVYFLKTIRHEARRYFEKRRELGIYFRHFRESNSPEILYFLTYSKLEQSIEDYKKEDLFTKIKVEFVNNMLSMGYDLNEELSFEEIDKLVVFTERQRYAIYKLLHDINGTFDLLYDLVLFFEKIIKKNTKDLKKILTNTYKKLEDTDLFRLDTEKILEPIIKSNKIENIEVTCLIQFSEVFGFSMFEEDKTKDIKGYLFLGLVPFELHGLINASEDNKNEMFNKFTLLSDTTRFNIIVLLSKGAMFGREISEHLNISTGTISHHLSNLLQEQIITSEVKGKRIYYRLNTPELKRMSQFLKQLGEKCYEK